VSFSVFTNVNNGVPQGGILSPVYYNLYAGDQPSSPNTSVYEFADYKTVITIYKDAYTPSINFQNHLELISDWSKSARTQSAFSLCPEVFLNNILFSFSETVEKLTIHRYFTWFQHIIIKILALNEPLRMPKTFKTH